ncbi:MAG: hypothetical protein Q8R72_06505 [Hylemonella sp.]|nr:hypothetical protein [Hylemonella sp.]
MAAARVNWFPLLDASLILVVNLPVTQILRPEPPAGFSVVREILREYADILKINLFFEL